MFVVRVGGCCFVPAVHASHCPFPCCSSSPPFIVLAICCCCCPCCSLPFIVCCPHYLLSLVFCHSFALLCHPPDSSPLLSLQFIAFIIPMIHCHPLICCCCCCCPCISSSSAPPSPPMSSGSQVGWWCCVMWCWWPRLLSSKGPIAILQAEAHSNSIGCWHWLSSSSSSSRNRPIATLWAEAHSGNTRLVCVIWYGSCHDQNATKNKEKT